MKQVSEANPVEDAEINKVREELRTCLEAMREDDADPTAFVTRL
jgi:hypothetical protein